MMQTFLKKWMNSESWRPKKPRRVRQWETGAGGGEQGGMARGAQRKGFLVEGLTGSSGPAGGSGLGGLGCRLRGELWMVL